MKQTLANLVRNGITFVVTTLITLFLFASTFLIYEEVEASQFYSRSCTNEGRLEYYQSHDSYNVGINPRYVYIQPERDINIAMRLLHISNPTWELNTTWSQRTCIHEALHTYEMYVNGRFVDNIDIKYEQVLITDGYNPYTPTTGFQQNIFNETIDDRFSVTRDTNVRILEYSYLEVVLRFEEIEQDKWIPLIVE
jgi:hypothetical protein